MRDEAMLQKLAFGEETPWRLQSVRNEEARKGMKLEGSAENKILKWYGHV
jgi:hypothetical protein